MMELVVRLARATNTSIQCFLDMPLNRLSAWAAVVIDVIKKENNHG
jgi:hypothetical protein